MKTIKTYITADGQDLYAALFKKLHDPVAKPKIASRINRMASDNFGDHKPWREGVRDLMIDQGAGYRIYYSLVGNEVMVDALREDPDFAQAYLHQAFLDIDEDGGQEAFLLALRHVVEARGGMAVVAQKAGVSRESLYRTLSPTGNPTLKTLRSVVHAAGFQFSSLVSA